MKKRSQTVLLIDDDTDLTEAIGCHLRSEFDVEVIVANDPLLAVHRLQEFPDIVVCDVLMPTGNGLSILEMMDGDDRWRDTPVIVLTGCSDGDTLQRVGSIDAQYVAKSPNTWPQLRRLVTGLLAPSEEFFGLAARA